MDFNAAFVVFAECLTDIQQELGHQFHKSIDCQQIQIICDNFIIIR